MVSRQIFDSLLGSWKLNRLYTSRLADYPSGSSEGIAEFTTRVTTDNTEHAELLYNEETIFTPNDSSPTIKGTRKYVYSYNHDKIHVLFIDDNASDLRLFHEIGIKEHSSTIKATGEHFCEPDNYTIKYEFNLKDANMKRWTLEYRVKGPRKDYTISTCYTKL